MSRNGLSNLRSCVFLPGLQGFRRARNVGGMRTCTASGPCLMPLHSSTVVKFVMYKSVAAHPIFGDEARELSTAKGRQESTEWNPDRALVALRHPRLSGADLQQVQKTYASKLWIGGPAVIVDDTNDVFFHAQLLDDMGDMMRVRPTKSQENPGRHACSYDLQVASSQVFGGWPARDMELTYPVRMLVHDVAFMWPDIVSQDVEVKCAGVPVHPETCLGILLRTPDDLSITVNHVEYPLELDMLANRASRAASKRAGRQKLFEVLLSEMHFLLKVWPLLVFWLAVEIKMYIMRQCSVEQKITARQPQPPIEDVEACGEIQPNQVDFSNIGEELGVQDMQIWNERELQIELAMDDDVKGYVDVSSNLQGWGEIRW